MKFDRAVNNCPALAGALRSGLQALRSADKARVTCANTRCLTGSVDVDSALSQALPHQPRWDYAIGVKHDRVTDVVTWIEVHPASSTSEVEKVIAKLDWLKSWTAEHAPDLKRLTREYIWIATGKVAFSASSQQRKRLAVVGIQFAGSQYNLQPQSPGGKR